MSRRRKFTLAACLLAFAVLIAVAIMARAYNSIAFIVGCAVVTAWHLLHSK
jgi:hypothetical protein